MVVLLDTNQVFDDPFLNRPSLLAMLRHQRDGSFDVAVPAVVVDEAIRQYGKHLDRRPERALDDLVEASDDPPPELGDPAWLSRYRERLVTRLDELGIRVLPEPPHNDVEIWRSDGRKPFKRAADPNDGDARIWATALEVASEAPVILVSTNHKDFGDGPEIVAPALVSDLSARGLATDRIRLRSSLVRVLGDLGAPHVARAEAADLLERGRGKRAILDKARHVATARLVDDEDAAQMPFDIELDPEAVYVEIFDTEDVRVDAAFRVDPDIAVEASVVGHAWMDVFVYKPDAYGLRDDSPIVIHDYDFNESYAEGQVHFRVEVVLETAVSPSREVAPPAVIAFRNVG